MEILSALAVSGDAFLLERGDTVILFDGGRSPTLLAAALVAHRPKLRCINIVVCSHADQDHAEGLVGFPVAWALACGKDVKVEEFWLPGRWKSVVATGLRDPKRLIDAIINDVDAFNASYESLSHADGPSIECVILGEIADACDLGECEIDKEEDTLQKPNAGSEINQPDGVRLEEGWESDPQEKPIATAASWNIEQTMSSLEAATEAEKQIEKPEGVIGRRRYSRRLRIRPNHAGSSWSRDPGSSSEPEWVRELEQQAHSVAKGDPELRHRFALGRRRIEYRALPPNHLGGGRPSSRIAIGSEAAKFWLNLIDTAERIGRVAATAIAAASRIRWFDQEEFELTGMRRGGRPRLLLPMNSCEQRSLVQPEPPEGAVLYMLSISQANRQSLVFYGPPKALNAFGVVFAADTALTWGSRDSWELTAYRRMRSSETIATAPHHGSENNAIGYAHGAMHYNVQGWLRGHNGPAPGKAFKSQEWRACTECPNRHARRTVQLSLMTPLASMFSYDCSCI